jgi:predicted regulator of Ras-like GTPase activity (Roadblock/LC7/MglB family)
MAIQGHLHEMGIPTLVQLSCQEGARARLSIRRDDAQAILYFADGNVVHATLRPGEGQDGLQGEEVVYRILNWEEGAFSLETGVDPPAQTIHTPWAALLMEGLQRRDEERWNTLEKEEITRRDTMSARTTTDILKDFLNVPGISTAVVVGRDGFVIETAGGTKALNIDALGASLANAINGIEMMGQELKIRTFQDLFVEYQGALILSRPVGDAIIALVAPDASKLGIVRYQIKPLVKELASFF